MILKKIYHGRHTVNALRQWIGAIRNLVISDQRGIIPFVRGTTADIFTADTIATHPSTADFTVVPLAGDLIHVETVELLKDAGGENRPLLVLLPVEAYKQRHGFRYSDDDRAFIVSYLKGVRAVVRISREEDVGRVLRRIQPASVVESADYLFGDAPRRICEEYDIPYEVRPRHLLEKTRAIKDAARRASP